MNQNVYTIRVKKSRSLTILPQLRNLFPREIMAANANNECILMEKVSAVTIKKIVKETDIYANINKDWVYIPVRTPEYDIDAILSQSVVDEAQINNATIIDDQKEEPSPIVHKEEPKATPTVNVPDDKKEETNSDVVVVNDQKEDSHIENKEDEQDAPQVDLKKVPYKSIPRTNNRNDNGKHNDYKK